jgi:hypothetical protein
MSRSSTGHFPSSVFHSLTDRRFLVILAWLTILAAGVYLFIFEPGKSGFFPLCPFRALTGLNCPGCGTTRCLHQLLHGNIVAAFKLNPLFVVALPFLLWALARFTNAAIVNRPPAMTAMNPRYVWSIVALIVSFWIFRNTSLYPFPS